MALVDWQPPPLPWGTYSSEWERYERIFLERREHNEAGQMPREEREPQMVSAAPEEPQHGLTDEEALEAVTVSPHTSRLVKDLVKDELLAAKPKRRYRRRKP
jgi:hypothetical protein